MRQIFLRSVAAVAAALLCSTVMAARQAPSTVPATYQPKTTYTPGRTPWGDPDLQGTYTNKDESGVPLERPNDLPARWFVRP